MHAQNGGRRIAVAHSVSSWLEQTQTWIFSQIVCLPQHVESHIICETTRNLDQFALPNIHSLEHASKLRVVWDKGLRKLRLRRHLGFLSVQARRHTTQILHSHFGPCGWTNLRAAKRLGLKHVVTFYGYDVSYIPKSDKQWLQRYAELFDEVDLVLCEGPHMAKCIAQLGCPPRKVRVHHLGVMLERIAFQPRSWSPGEPLRVLIAASFREKKGIPYALEALGRAQNDVDLQITVIGDATGDLREKQTILDMIAKHRLERKTRMLGFQPHAVLLQEAHRNHVYICPSVTAADGDTEGGAPIAMIEMAATGMPVISTFHCDIPEVIQNGVTGLLARERDVDGIVTHLKWLVDNPGAWVPMARRARAHLEAQFSCGIQGASLGDIYAELVRSA